MPGVDAGLIASRLTTADPADRAVAEDRGAAVRELADGAAPGDVVLTMGAGDVTALGADLVARLADDPSAASA